jgi:hypothetical protein
MSFPTLSRSTSRIKAVSRVIVLRNIAKIAFVKVDMFPQMRNQTVSETFELNHDVLTTNAETETVFYVNLPPTVTA